MIPSLSKELFIRVAISSCIYVGQCAYLLQLELDRGAIICRTPLPRSCVGSPSLGATLYRGRELTDRPRLVQPNTRHQLSNSRAGEGRSCAPKAELRVLVPTHTLLSTLPYIRFSPNCDAVYPVRVTVPGPHSWIRVHVRLNKDIDGRKTACSRPTGDSANYALPGAVARKVAVQHCRAVFERGAEHAAVAMLLHAHALRVTFDLRPHDPPLKIKGRACAWSLEAWAMAFGFFFHPREKHCTPHGTPHGPCSAVLTLKFPLVL